MIIMISEMLIHEFIISDILALKCLVSKCCMIYYAKNANISMQYTYVDFGWNLIYLQPEFRNKIGVVSLKDPTHMNVYISLEKMKNH